MLQRLSACLADIGPRGEGTELQVLSMTTIEPSGVDQTYLQTCSSQYVVLTEAHSSRIKDLGLLHPLPSYGIRVELRSDCNGKNYVEKTEPGTSDGRLLLFFHLIISRHEALLVHIREKIPCVGEE